MLAGSEANLPAWLQVNSKWAETGAQMVAIAGGLIAAFKATAELRESNKQKHEANLQREEDLRWRRAHMAKQCIDEIRHHPLASLALNMLDWDGRRYLFPPGVYAVPAGAVTHRIEADKRRSALRTVHTTFDDDSEVFVRDCFDALFDGFQNLEHYLKIKLIVFEDLEQAFTYYAEKLSDPAEFPTACKFLKEYQFDDALDFLGRFGPWRKAVAGLSAHVVHPCPSEIPHD